MRIRVITSCTGEKRYSPANKLTQSSFKQLHDTRAFKQIEERLADFCTPAAEMYTGQQHVRLIDGVRRFQEKRTKDEIDLWILSAGYGLIPGRQEIVPYECTFRGMKVGEIRAWAKHLCIPQTARALFTQPADLVIVLLGNNYLRTLELDEEVIFAAPTLFFTGRNSEKHVKGQGKIRVVTLSNADATRFSCGMVGLKGELGKRILFLLAEHGSNSPVSTFLDSDLLGLVDDVFTS